MDLIYLRVDTDKSKCQKVSGNYYEIAFILLAFIDFLFNFTGAIIGRFLFDKKQKEGGLL